MKRVAVIFLFLIFVIPLIQLNAGPLPQRGGQVFVYGEADDADLSRSLAGLSQQIKTWFAAGDMVGAEWVVIKGKKIVMHEVVGWKNREKKVAMERNTIFRIRSMTKPFVGTAILMLLEEGKLKLEHKAARYLASYNNEKSKEITIGQLITMTAGFTQGSYPRALIFCKNLGQAVDAVAAQGPPLPVGGQWKYSDKCSATLAAIVAQVTGKPAEAFIRKRILHPLGLASTFCNLKEKDPRRKRVSCTYRWSGGPFVKYWDSSQPQVLKFFRGSGGIYSSPLDYARFLLFWRHKGVWQGRRLLRAATVAKALTPTPLYSHYAMHWQIFSEAADHQLPVFGHGGSDGTLAVMIPQKDLMVLYFTQSRGGATVSRMRRLILKTFL
jgi:CubicO group peptidase (beta-lactamase class C family)